jgi:phosphonate transport system substrate-binding protein
MITRRRALLASAGLLAAPAILSAAAFAENAMPTYAIPAKGKRDWAAQVPTLRIGLLGGENDSDRLGRYQDYQKLLEETFQIPVRLFPAADYAGVIQGFGARQIEIASMGSSGYAGAWIDTNGNVVPLVVAVESDGSTSHHSVVVVRTDSGITKLDELKGRTLAWADPNSTSGYLIPRFELKQSGYDPEPGKFFSKTGFGGGHEQAVVAVLQKQYDACCTWVSGIGDPSVGYTRGNLHEMVAKGTLKISDIRILWMSRPIMNGPLTARKDTPQGFRDDIAAFHLALPTSHPQIYEQIERGGGKGYQKVTHEQFQLFVDLRMEEAKNRRQRS